LFNASPCIRAAAALATLAMVVSGCAAANNATSSQASSQGEQPYKTMYGISSEGTTTDLYTELFGPRQAPPAPATAVATAQPTQPAQPAAAQPITSPPAVTVTSPARPAQAATATAANRSPQAIAPPAPVQVAQPPALPPAQPPQPDVPTAYGITANGPTTDLYTMIFGPRRSEGQ